MSRADWLLGDESPAGFPDEIAGVPVAGWSSPQATAAVLSTTSRTLQRWERKGLPSAGSGREKLYPWPHALVWARFYRREKAEGGSGVSRLEIAVALGRHNLEQIRQGAPPIFGR